MRKGQFMRLTLVLMLLLVFTACAPTPAAPAPTPMTVVPTPSASAGVSPIPGMIAWEVEWEKLVNAAQKEGRLVAFSTTGAVTSRALSTNFKKRYGISVELLEAKGGELTTKLFAERRAGLFLEDLWLGGATTAITDLRPAGILAPLEPMFVLPELTDPELIKKTWWEGKLPWVDPEHTIFPFIAYASGQFMINTTMVKPGEVKGWKDLLDPKWTGKIIINDPTVSGSGALWHAVLVHKIMGLDYMRELVKQQPIVLRDQRQQVEWVAKGKYAIAVSAKEDVVWEFTKAGAPLETIRPQEGMYITAGSGNVFLLTKAPHPNTAKLFINWLLSREGQTIYSSSYGAQSARNDVLVEKLDPTTLRQLGVEYFDSNRLEFKLKMDDYMKLAKETFAPVMR